METYKTLQTVPPFSFLSFSLLILTVLIELACNINRLHGRAYLALAGDITDYRGCPRIGHDFEAKMAYHGPGLFFPSISHIELRQISVHHYPTFVEQPLHVDHSSFTLLSPTS